MTTKEILQKARELLAIPGKWGRCSYAMDAVGNSICPTDPAAVCFCSYGALLHVQQITPMTFNEASNVLLRACRDSFGSSPIGLNDRPTTTLDTILALYDKAIALCDEAGVVTTPV